MPETNRPGWKDFAKNFLSESLNNVFPKNNYPPNPILSNPYEISSHLTDRFLEKKAQQTIYEEFLAALNPTNNGEFLNKGEDCIARVVEYKGKKIVCKELLPTSRYFKIFGLGIDPRDITTQTIRNEDINFEAPVNLEGAAESLRNLQALVETYVGFDDSVVQTATKVANGKIYRIQRYIEHPNIAVGNVIEKNIKNNRLMLFYDEVKKRWLDMTFSADLNMMPRNIQEYCKNFPADDGVGSNAIFMGLGAKPEFMLIDY